jgi:hypothetical protein
VARLRVDASPATLINRPAGDKAPVAAVTLPMTWTKPQGLTVKEVTKALAADASPDAV